MVLWRLLRSWRPGRGRAEISTATPRLSAGVHGGKAAAIQRFFRQPHFDPDGGSQNATLVVVVVVVVVVLVVVISSLKIPKAFLIRSGAQRNFAYAFVLTFSRDLRSQIFKLISN